MSLHLLNLLEINSNITRTLKIHYKKLSKRKKRNEKFQVAPLSRIMNSLFQIQTN